MYKVGDYVVKATEGVCEIVAIEPLDMQGISKDVLYLHLVPVENKSVKLYLPESGAKDKLRDVITEEETLKLIDNIFNIEPVEIPYEKQRDKVYKEALLSSDPEKLVAVIKAIYIRNEKRQIEGKKNGAVDEHFFKAAEERLYAELAFALKKDKEEMKEFIIRKINGN